MSKSRLRPRGRVYVIEAVGTDRLKIGWTEGSVADRVRNLQCGSPYELRPLWTMQGGREEESVLHERFAAYRLRGEWFVRDGDLAEWLDGLAVAVDRYLSLENP